MQTPGTASSKEEVTGFAASVSDGGTPEYKTRGTSTLRSKIDSMPFVPWIEPNGSNATVEFQVDLIAKN